MPLLAHITHKDDDDGGGGDGDDRGGGDGGGAAGDGGDDAGVGAGTRIKGKLHVVVFLLQPLPGFQSSKSGLQVCVTSAFTLSYLADWILVSMPRYIPV